MLQEDLHKMHLWSRKWLLLFHPEKLKMLTITSSKQPRNCLDHRVYFIGDFRVQQSTLETDLGVDVDPLLNFNEHIANRVKSASITMGAIRRSFRYMNHGMFRLLFKGMVRCKLEYAAPVWSPSSEDHVDKIESVQRSATSMLGGMKGLDYPERLKHLKLTTLRARRWRGDMIETFKLVHGFYDKTVAPPLPLRADSSARPLRGHPLLLQTERNTTARRRSSFTQRVVPLWNSLSWEVVKPSTVNTFKNRLDKAWEGQAFLYNYKEYPTGARLSATIY